MLFVLQYFFICFMLNSKNFFCNKEILMWAYPLNILMASGLFLPKRRIMLNSSFSEFIKFFPQQSCWPEVNSLLLLTLLLHFNFRMYNTTFQSNPLTPFWISMNFRGPCLSVWSKITDSVKKRRRQNWVVSVCSTFGSENNWLVWFLIYSFLSQG